MGQPDAPRLYPFGQLVQENRKDRIYMIREIRGNCRNYIYEKSSEKEGDAIKTSSKTLIREPEKVGQKLLCFS